MLSQSRIERTISKITVCSVKVLLYEVICVVDVACHDVYISHGLIAMLVVRQGHGIVGTIAVVRPAHGGQWERHGFGAKAFWSLFASDNAA